MTKVDFIVELLEESLSESRLYLLNYIKSLCELASLSSKGKIKLKRNDTINDIALMKDVDRDKIRELTLEQFKGEVNIMVKRINEAISTNLGQAKTLTLQKVEKVVFLIQRVGLIHLARAR